MSQQIFDHERPRSTMARRLDEAFAGCDEWTIAPPAARRVELDVAPWLNPRRPSERGSYGEARESRAA